MEGSPLSHWKVRLQQLLNHPEFHSATDEQRLEVLREVSRQVSTTVENLNEVIREGWRYATSIPQLSNTRGQLQLTYLSTTSLSPQSTSPVLLSQFSPPKSLSPVLDSETFSYANSREETLDRRFVDQLQEFIRNEPVYLEQEDRQFFITQLNELLYQVESTINNWQRSQQVNRIDHVKIPDGWQRRFTRLLLDIRKRRHSNYPIDINPDYLKIPPHQHRQIIDVQTVREPLTKILAFVNGKLAEETKNFGENSDFTWRWLALKNEINNYPAKILSQQLTWKDLIGKTLTWREEIMTTLELQQAAGRRCKNTNDPWDSTPIEDIPSSDYIHLSNGMCWHIESLMEYIKGVNGLNDSKGLPNYASSRIWEDEDLPRILQHTVVRRTGFGEWLQRILSSTTARIITRDTLDWLYWLASIFVSRGEPFNQELRKVLTNEEYSIYQKYTGGNSDNLKRIPADMGLTRIQDKIKIKMKNDAFIGFMQHYDSLSPSEKEALELLYPGFQRDISSCNRGQVCVYVIAGTLMKVYTRSAQLKGIHPLTLDLTEK